MPIHIVFSDLTIWDYSLASKTYLWGQWDRTMNPYMKCLGNSELVSSLQSHLLSVYSQVPLSSNGAQNSHNSQIHSKKLTQSRLWNSRELQISESAWLRVALLWVRSWNLGIWVLEGSFEIVLSKLLIFQMRSGHGQPRPHCLWVESGGWDSWLGPE